MDRALIVDPDRRQRKILKSYIESVAHLSIFEFDSEDKALSWLKSSNDELQFIFLQWNVSANGQDWVSTFRSQERSKSADIIVSTTTDDFEWLKTMRGMSEFVDNILVKPFRPTTFIQRMNQILGEDLKVGSSALLIEEDPEMREILKDYLQTYGFSKIYEADDAQKGYAVLMERYEDILMVVNGWKESSIIGLQSLKNIRQANHLSTIPFVVVTSQASLDNLRALQTSDLGVRFYLKRPFEVGNFRSELGAAISERAKILATESVSREVKDLIDNGETRGAIALILRPSQEMSEASPLLELLGDAYGKEGKSTGSPADLLLACDAYEKAIKQAPHQTRIVSKCLDLYLDLGKTAEAIRLLKGYIKKLGLDDGLRTRLGKLYLQAGDYGAACVELRRALNINPGNIEAQSIYQVAVSLKKGFQ